MKETKNFGKTVLANSGIKVFQKDIKKVELLNVTTHTSDCGEGLAPDSHPSRQIVLVERLDGKVYEVLRETVDEDGNYSTASMRWENREVRVK